MLSYSVLLRALILALGRSNLFHFLPSTIMSNAREVTEEKRFPPVVLVVWNLQFKWLYLHAPWYTTPLHEPARSEHNGYS